MAYGMKESLRNIGDILSQSVEFLVSAIKQDQIQSRIMDQYSWKITLPLFL